jgi:hypothetical protein
VDPAGVRRDWDGATNGRSAARAALDFIVPERGEKLDEGEAKQK